MSFPPLSPLTEKLFDLPDYAQREDNICSMVNFFPEAKRLLDAIGLERIVEIGSEAGLNTAVLLDYVKSRKKKLITVDPAAVPFPFSPPAESAFTFYQETSAEFLKRNISAEVIFMDGDHNYETVLADLKAIHETRKKSGIKLLFLHDVSWPWARQDIYYDPARISHPHPYHAENRVTPYAEENAPSLSPANYMTADRAGGAENGVLTAVEDFLKLYGASWQFRRIPVLYGIGILISKENVPEAEKRKLLPLVDELASHCELLSILELNRIENLCQYDTLCQKLTDAGNTWRNDQGYIKTVNEILPGLSAEIQTKTTEIEHLRQSLAEKDALLYKEQTESTNREKEQDAHKCKLERDLHTDSLRLQAAAYEKTFFVNKLEELKLLLKKESETVLQYQTELNAARDDLSDRESRIQALTAAESHLQAELGTVRNDLSDRENRIQSLTAAESQLQAELGTVRNDLSDRESRIQALTAAESHLQAELGTVRNDLSDRESRIQALTAAESHLQAELRDVRDDLSDREKRIRTLTELKNQREKDLSSKEQEIRTLQGDLQQQRQLSEEQQNRISELQDQDIKHRCYEWSLEQDLRRCELESPAAKWRTKQCFFEAILPYGLRNRRKLKRIKKALTDGSIKLLSLDVFDTLLFRELRSESGRFSDVGKILHRRYPRITAKQFYYARSLAHYLAYRVCTGREGCREPGMEEIFRIMVKILQQPEEIIPDLMKVELEYETAHLRLNSTIWELVLLAREQNIPVVATSDMYWGREALQKIFAVRLPDPDAIVKIYSSSDYGVSKAAGLLFDHIVKEDKVDYSQILHIGDNLQSDFTVPFTRYYMPVYWLPRSKIYTAFCNRLQKYEKKKLQERNIIHGL